MPNHIWESKIGHLEQISAKNPYGTFFLITLYQLVVQGIDPGADFSLLSLEPKPHMNNHTIYLHEGHMNMTLNQEHTTKTTLVW